MSDSCAGPDAGSKSDDEAEVPVRRIAATAMVGMLMALGAGAAQAHERDIDSVSAAAYEDGIGVSVGVTKPHSGTMRVKIMKKVDGEWVVHAAKDAKKTTDYIYNVLFGTVNGDKTCHARARWHAADHTDVTARGTNFPC